MNPGPGPPPRPDHQRVRRRHPRAPGPRPPDRPCRAGRRGDPRPELAPAPDRGRRLTAADDAEPDLQAPAGSNTMAIKAAQGRAGTVTGRSNPMATIAPVRPKISSPPPPG